MSMPRRIRFLIEAVARRHGVHPRQLTHKRASKNVLLALRETMQEMVAIGLTPHQIGRYLDRDHTTVLHHLRRLRRSAAIEDKRLRWHRPRIRHLNNCHCNWCHPNRDEQRRMRDALCEMSKAMNRLAPKPEEPPRPPKPRKRFLVPYAGYDPDRYVWKEAE